MADKYIFKIASSDITGNTTSYGSSLYLYLEPSRPVKFSTDGGLTINSTLVDGGDIDDIIQRVDDLEITVYGNTSSTGLVARVDTLEISGATVDTRLNTLEVSGSTVNSRLDELDISGETTNVRINSLELSGVTINTRVGALELAGGTVDTRLNTLELSGETVDSRLLIVEADVQAKAPMLVYVTDTSSTTAIIDVYGGTHYEFTQPLTGMTISSIQDSHYESEIVFTGGTALVVDLPASVYLVNSPTFSEGKNYIVSIRDNKLVAGEFELNS